MLCTFRNGQTGVVIRVKILDTSRTDGGGLTGLTPTSAGLVISTIADNEPAAVVYRASDSTIEAVATPGVYQAPSAGRCRFREVDAVNHRGLYELHLPDARFAIAGAKSLLVSIFGATNSADTDAQVPLTVVDPFAANGGFDPWAVTLPGTYGPQTTGGRLANVDVAVSTRSTFAGGVVQGVTNPVTVSQNLDKAGYALAANGVDAIAIEAGINLRQSQSTMLAALAGTLSGSGTGTIVVNAANSTAPRIMASTDASGNRTAISLTFPS